ncbi:MAG TPA: hypothetical protein VFT47_07325 [Vicinamibacterales bacterium]|nr:hypothetical protein [Vicinamibacterales bacterium]
MNTFRAFGIGAIAAAGITMALAAQTPASPDRVTRADFANRVNTYVALKAAARQTVLPLVTLDDPAEIRHRTDALATVIRSARSQARQGDIFTPEIARMIRRAVRDGCEGDYAALVAVIREEYDKPMPVPVINGRWPAAVPLPTMLPGLLAALPPLPAGLQYRFMNTALVLLDIDANLIVDFVPEAVPIATEAHDAH